MLLYLLSDDLNSLERHPRNSLSDFTISFPQPYKLHGEWEVAILEVQIPHTWVEKHDSLELSILITYTYYRASRQDVNNFKYTSEDITYTVPKKSTLSVDEILKFLNQTLPHLQFIRNSDNYVEIHYDFRLIPVPGEGDLFDYLDAEVTSFSLSDLLSDILGFKAKHFEKINFKPQNPITTTILHPFLPRGLQIVGVHCDLVESQLVSSSYHQLLRFIATRRTEISTSQTDTFISPIFVPIQKNVFTTVRIQLLDLDKKRIPFEGGVVMLCLKLRPKSDNTITM